MISLRFFTVLIGVIFVIEGMAYSCDREIELENLFVDSDVALVGTVKKKLFELSFSKDQYLIEVESAQKGKTEREIVVWTKSKCRARFSVNQKYVIFMNLSDGKFWTDMNMAWRIYDKTEPLTEKYLEYHCCPVN